MIRSRIYQIAFITYCLLLQCIPLKSQDTTALLQQLKEAKRDTLKASLYAKLAGKYYYSNPQRSLEFAQEGIKFAAARNAEKYLPELYYAAGTANNLLGNDEGALASLKSADSVATRTNNIDIQVNSLRTSGYIFMTQSNYDQAGKLLFRALEIAQENKNEGLAAIVYSTISSLYINQANYDKAIFYGEKGLQYFRHSGNPQQLGSNALNLGLVYAEQKDYKKAQLLYDEALAAYTRVDFKLGIATVYGNISNIIVNDKPKQIAYLLKAKAIWDSISPDHPNAIGNTGNLGLAYLSLVTDTTVRVLKDSLIPATRAERLEKAERYLLYAVEMCKKLDFGRDLAYFTSSLAELEEVKGDYKLANTYLHEYIRLNDTLFSQDNKNKLAEKESKYVIDRKNAELEINKLTIANNQKIGIGLAAGLLLVTVIGGLLYYQNRTRKKTNTTLLQLNAKLDEANKAKATFFAILSHDLRSPVANLVNFLQLQKRAPGLLNEQQVADKQSKITAAAGSLLETMETMLLWSKEQMEKFEPELKEIDVQEIFHSVEKMYPSSEQVTISFDDPLQLTINTDENYLRTIMQNLTSNAIKAMGAKNGSFVKWLAHLENGSPVLSITDNGPGLDSDEIFWDDKLRHINGSNGLGMLLVKDLATAINCRITVASSSAGTCFKLFV